MPWAITADRRATPCARLLLYPIQTRPHQSAQKLIAVSHNCTVMFSVILWTFDNLLWLEAPGVPHIYLPKAASLNSKGFYEVHIVQLCNCQSSWHPQIKSVTSHKMNQFIWRNCGNAAVAACSCLCKSKRELTSSAGAGCLFFWSLSLHFISGASLIKPFGETTRVVRRPRSDLWALPEAVLVYILPSALTDCFLFGFIPVHCGVNVSVVCHRRRQMPCELWFGHTQPGQTRAVGWFALRQRRQQQNSIHSSNIMWLLSLSVISYHHPCFYLQPITVSIIFSKL